MQPIERTDPSNQSNNISRLVLGTAQLGMSYGIANKSGKPNSDLAKEIIQTAWENGIREYDTAQGYGESEKVLGRGLHSLGFSSDARVITKLDPSLDHLDRAALEQAVKKSLTRLRVPILQGLMLHKEEYLKLWKKGLGGILQNFVKKGLARYLGVSVYSPDSALLALETDGIDTIQIPSNILDRRFEETGVFQLAENNGKQIYVRSIFLQGLLFMEREKIPANMQFAVEVLNKLEDYSQEIGLSKQELALAYVKKAFPKTKVVFGVESPDQIRENLKGWNRTLPAGFVERIQEDFGYVGGRLLNPALWPQRVV